MPELSPSQAQQIAYLYELGVIEFLKKRIRNHSDITVAHYVGAILGIPQQTIKTPMLRIKTGGIADECFLVAKEFIRQRKHPLVPLPDIKFDNEIED